MSESATAVAEPEKAKSEAKPNGKPKKAPRPSAPKAHLTADNFRGEEALPDVAGLVLHRDLQPREKLEDVDRQAANVAEALARGERVADRVLVVRIPAGTKRKSDGATVEAGDYVCDGHGRVRGYRLAGRAKVPAWVRVGTWEDALDVATSANIHHKAMPRSYDDKTRAVLLTLTTHPEWSDRLVSEHCAVGHDLPKKLRPEAEKRLREIAAATGQPERAAQPAKRVGKDGRLQAARKAKPKAPKSPLDWDGFGARWAWIVKFIDAVADAHGRVPEFQKAHGAHKATGKVMRAWLERINKDLAAGAEAEAKAKKAEAAKGK